jgi:primosomal protein N'
VYIVTVSPIARGAFTDQLTYWSAHFFNPGSIISVPFRSKEISALVQRCESASDAKMGVKNASFEARKIEEQVKEIKLIRSEAVEAARFISEFYCLPIGSVLSAFIPTCAFNTKENSTQEQKKPDIIKIDTNESGVKSNPPTAFIVSRAPSSETLTVQSATEDRAKTYKSIIREEFARRKSVLVIAPRIIDAENIFEQLTKGIENSGVMIHSGMSKKRIEEEWQRARDASHPIIYVSTPGFSMIPRDDISVIIIEQEASRMYFAGWSPKIDWRMAIEKYGSLIGARVVLGDTLLRIETLARRDKGLISDISQAVFRVEKAPQTIVVNMNDKEHKIKDGFKLISEELWSMIDYAKKKNERMVIFCSRRGLSPQTLCGDCGKTVMCTRCSSPVVLHQPKSGDRFFLCHHCGEKRSALEACKNCGGWKLTTLGIGIDTIGTLVEKKYPDSKTFKIDKDAIKKESDGKKIIKDFLKNDHAILLITETGLPFIPTVPYIAIASFDSLFSIPDFRISERIVHNLIDLAEKTEKYFLIQSRNAESPLLKTVAGGGLMEFFRMELEAREKMGYPPFMTFIKLTISAPKVTAMEILEDLQTKLEEWSPIVFPAFTATLKNEVVMHILLKIENDYWKDVEKSKSLRQIILSLSREVAVQINPESML